MAFWRYIRDVFIAIATLLVISGLIVGWWTFFLLVTAGAALGSYFTTPKNRRIK